MRNQVETVEYAPKSVEVSNSEVKEFRPPITLSRIFFTEPDPTVEADPLRLLVEQWASVAVSHARVRELDDTFVADVVGVRGAWSSGPSPDAARDSLRAVLVEWAQMKLDDGDTDIPRMEGIRLVLET